MSELSEANTANAIFTQIGVGTAADFAAIVCLGRILRLFLLLEFH
jgi:hypothetical protein